MTVVLIALTIVSAAVVAVGAIAWWFLSTYPDPTGDGR